jgi:signal transduction histidine kinase
MRPWLAAFMPNRIGGQILLLVLFSVVLTQAFNVALMFATEDGRHEEMRLRTELGTFLGAVRMIGSSDGSAWDTIASVARQDDPEIGFSYERNAPWPANSTTNSTQLSFIQRDLGPGYQVRETEVKHDETGNLRDISVLLPNGVMVSARLALPPAEPRRPFPAYSLWIFALVFLPLIFFWAARGLSGQLRNFARAAEDFSLEGEHKLLPETGPKEIQQVAKAFNRMRERIAGLIDDRTRMLGAIGHDLRTPITRLRLRAEFINDDKTRREILKDLDRMNRMVDSALSYIRDGLEREAKTPVDLGSLLRTVVDNFADLGENVGYEGQEHLTISARPDALVRAVENLIENALKFGSQAIVRARLSGDGKVVIEVEDNGAGIPEMQRAAMLEPFVRGDAARSGPSSGFGLGLAITESIAKAHGGHLALGTGSLGGLLASISLPIGKVSLLPMAAE